MADKNTQKKNVSTRRLMLMVTIVSRKKSDFYLDLIQSLGANLQFVTMGEGTADEKTMRSLGLSSSDKAVIFSVLPEEQANGALDAVEDKFRTIRGGKGVTFTVPLSSVIGTSVFNFLADNRMNFGR